MQPIYPYVQVEPIEDNSALALTVDQTPVVKVIATPICGPSEVVVGLVQGCKVLTNHVDEYMVDGNKLFFVRLKDIVSIV